MLRPRGRGTVYHAAAQRGAKISRITFTLYSRVLRRYVPLTRSRIYKTALALGITTRSLGRATRTDW